mmetsp:Transcript_22483/g.44173  ORF Transcript_22483/g.44173 Transcript_22483/m.44173 type:complete len:202 (+) Transcript_22483:1867-2472(+)
MVRCEFPKVRKNVDGALVVANLVEHLAVVVESVNHVLSDAHLLAEVGEVEVASGHKLLKSLLITKDAEKLTAALLEFVYQLDGLIVLHLHILSCVGTGAGVLLSDLEVVVGHAGGREVLKSRLHKLSLVVEALLLKPDDDGEEHVQIHVASELARQVIRDAHVHGVIAGLRHLRYLISDHRDSLRLPLDTCSTRSQLKSAD